MAPKINEFLTVRGMDKKATKKTLSPFEPLLLGTRPAVLWSTSEESFLQLQLLRSVDLGIPVA